MAATPQEIEAKAQAGDPRAQFAMAQICDGQGRHDLALGWLDRAARAGDTRAGALLGARLLTGYAAPKSPEQAAQVLLAAAKAGGAEAAELAAVFFATGRFLPQDWKQSFHWLAEAAERGEPRSRAQLPILARAERPSDPEAPNVWRTLADRIDASALLGSPAGKPLSASPRIRSFEGFMSPAECDWLVERARGRIKPARIYDDGSGGAAHSESRNNGSCEFHLIETDVIMAAVRARISAITGVPVPNLEDLSVLHYEVGQEFVRHVDFLNPDLPAYAKVIAERGQRVATFLVYLNDDFKGAETEFPALALRYRGRKGDAILFWNVDEQGRPDRRTLHAGLAPTAGRKWLLSQFLRDRPWPYA